MSQQLGHIERQLAAANKRIAELEAKYLALAEELKALRAELARRPVAAIGAPSDHGHGMRAPYEAQFNQWPGSER